MVLASCSDNELATNGTDFMKAGVKAFSSFNVTVEDSPITRTHIEDNTAVVWDEGDVIGVYSDMEDVVPFTYAGNNTFTSEKEVKGTVFYAYYPYAEGNAPNPGTPHMVSFSLPDYYMGTAPVMPMVATSQDNTLLFKQTLGMMHFTLQGEQHITEVSLMGRKHEPIVGSMTVDLTQDEPVLVAKEDNETYKITIACDIELGADDVKDFYFPVPTGSFADGFILTLNTAEGTFFRSKDGEVVVSRAKMQSYPQFKTDRISIEWTSLEKFYYATGGDNWTNNTNWLSDKPVGEWYGITVDERGTVVSLELYGNILSGNIPESIGNLTNLRSLDLGYNQLSGSIPESISNLTNLESLYLSANLLTGSIPESISNLTNLAYLRLSANQLTGSIPESIGNLTSLENLDLGANQLTGSIPESIGNLTSLESLSLEANQLTGSIPESISNLTNLGSSSLAVNLLTGSIPESIGNLTNLRYLDLCRNLLTGGIPESIGNLKDLELLDLHSNHLTGTIPEAFANITRSDFYLSINLNDMDGVISTSIQESAWWSNHINITQNEGHKLTLEGKESDSQSGNSDNTNGGGGYGE